jgi:predicted DNA-binding transcriptional regulator YafY
VPHLATVAEAVWASRPIEIAYSRDDAAVARRLEPLGLVLKAGIWYVVARSEDQLRTYRVSRIREARVLDEPFQRPAGFDLAAWWAESSGAYEREVPKLDVVVRVLADAEWRLADAVGSRVVREGQRVGPPDADGRQVFRITLDWPDEASGRFVAAAPEVEVIEPAQLRDQIRSIAGAAVEAYSRP